MLTIDFDFRNEIIKQNASLSYCYQCSTCSGACPVALLTNGKYNPRMIIEMALLGLHEKLITSQDSSIWLCSTCQKCVEVCPQKVDLTEIFIILKNKSFEEGQLPEAFLSQAEAILKDGIAIPYSNAIKTRRQKMALPMVKTAPIKELSKIFEKTRFENKISKGLK
ncbi:MAG: 4Fe-4S dicluster domain-containing protein [Candidatus Lokiarchaeota archaeon]|nr:4Fe-4S dicluster domain-containing protein [Candidatus Lokiarchaeota archaeon]MBD3339939.1 4Fe-4S dicluster domain-containing protein [Candidatus Lokiarchaeota archaeon]